MGVRIQASAFRLSLFASCLIRLAGASQGHGASAGNSAGRAGNPAGRAGFAADDTAAKPKTATPQEVEFFETKVRRCCLSAALAVMAQTAAGRAAAGLAGKYPERRSRRACTRRRGSGQERDDQGDPI